MTALDLDHISKLLDRQRPDDPPDNGSKRAAVAMILREGRDCMEMLFIERAADERDPWSGNLAFPGGRVEHGEEPREAAERETVEEIGLGLALAKYLGRLSDIGGTHLPVRVSCFVYGLTEHDIELALNDEVNDAFWVRLDDLRSEERHIIAPVRFADENYHVPAIRLPIPDKPVLWGLTHRLVLQLFEIISINLDLKIAF